MGSNSWRRFCAGSATCCAPAGAGGLGRALSWSAMETAGWWWLTKRKVIAKDDCLCGVQDEKTTLQAERPNLNSKWRKALLTLSARGGNGGMWWNNGVFCNELISYAVRTVCWIPLVIMNYFSFVCRISASWFSFVYEFLTSLTTLIHV